jgi:hypothetical protein
LSQLYFHKEFDKYHLVQIDSTMVAQTSTNLSKGLNFKLKNNDRKHAKFAAVFDDVLPCNTEMLLNQCKLTECLAISHVIKEHALKYN